jgi:hypothetical protein
MSATVAARIERLHAAHTAKQQLLSAPIDRTTWRARIAGILANPDNPRHARVAAIFERARQRRDHQDIA